MIRNAIFDWSGTLVDDLPAVIEATNHVFRQAGVPEMTRERFRAEFCLPFQRFYERFLPGIPLPQLETWFHGAFERAQALVTPLPQAREFLEFCRARRWQTFVLSSAHRRHYDRQAAETGFGAFIDHAYVGVADKVTTIHELLGAHQLHPRETLFIGDMAHDLEAARAGGVWSCAVLSGYNDAAQLRACGPDLVVQHLGDLRGLLEDTRPDIGGSTPPVVSVPERRVVATVGALILNEAGEALLVRTRKWSDRWGIPGGKIEFGETAEAAMLRELEEETGLAVHDLRLVLVQDCIRSPEFHQDAHFVLLNYTCRCRDGAAVRLNEEAQSYQWLAPAAALRLELNQPTRRLLEAVLTQPGATGDGLWT